MQGYAKCNNSMVSLQQRTIVEVVHMVSLNLSSFWWGSGAHTFVFITNLSIGLLFRMLTYNVARHQYLESAAFDEVTFSEWRIDESLSTMISYSQCDIEQQPLLPHNFDAISLLICINWNCHYTSDRRATPTTNEPSMEHIPWKMQSLIKANYHQRLIIAWVLRRCNSGQI